LLPRAPSFAGSICRELPKRSAPSLHCDNHHLLPSDVSFIPMLSFFPNRFGPRPKLCAQGVTKIVTRMNPWWTFLVERAGWGLEQLVDPFHNHLKCARALHVALRHQLVGAHRRDDWSILTMPGDVVVRAGP